MEMRLSLKDVKTVVDFTKMSEIIMAKESYFNKFGEIINTDNGPIVFKDNGSNILAVAHIDTVVRNPLFNGLFYVDKQLSASWNKFNPVNPCFVTPAVIRDKRKIKRSAFLKKEDSTLVVAASGLDDRLGAFIILEILPQLNVNCDIILTTNEERGMSTARGFEKYVAQKYDKKYNWFVEFDRRGEDCVTYRYDSKEFLDALKEVEFDIGVGSYTDICDMFEHGVCGMNVGVGYHDAHGAKSWFSIDMLYRNLNKFLAFYNKYKDTKFEIDTSEWNKRRTWQNQNTWQNDWIYMDYVEVDKPRNNIVSSGNDEDWGRKLEYVWFMCPYCSKTHNHIKKGDNFDCGCGITYKRSSMDGNIYKLHGASKRYIFAARMNKFHADTAKGQKVIWEECDICTTLESSGMSKIDGRNVCSRCKSALFSQCDWCEELFFSLGQIKLCEECHESFILYGQATQD